MKDKDTHLLVEMYQKIIENEDPLKLETEISNLKSKIKRLNNTQRSLFYIEDILGTLQGKGLSSFATKDVVSLPRMHGYGALESKELRSPIKTVLKRLESEGLISPILTLSLWTKNYDNYTELPGYSVDDVDTVKSRLEEIDKELSELSFNLNNKLEELVDKQYDNKAV